MQSSRPATPVPKRIRLLYAGGPGDLVATFRHWSAGRDDPSQVAATYSGQFYDLCRTLGADAYAISSNPRRELLVEGAFRIRNRPPLGAATGPMSKLTHFRSALWMIGAAIRFRADAVIIGDGTCYWFPLRLLPDPCSPIGAVQASR